MPQGAIIQILTLSGEVVANLHVNYPKEHWNGRNNYDAQISPGIYFYLVLKDNKAFLSGKLFVVN